MNLMFCFINTLVQALFHGLLGPYPKLEPALTKLAEEFFDWQWNEYLSKDVCHYDFMFLRKSSQHSSFSGSAGVHG